MIITQKISFVEILKLTWKSRLQFLLLCTITYLGQRYVFDGVFEISGILTTVLGTTLAFFIGFKNNQAYDRWWEARKVWGALVNDSRSWARSIINYCSANSESDEILDGIKKKLIHRHIAFLYALKSKLRGSNDKDFHKYLSQDEIESVEKQTNIHNAILTNQSKDLEHISKQGFIDGFRFIELNKLIVKFSDEMGMSERISNTVFPPTYHYFTRIFIWLFAITVTLLSAATNGAWSILIGWIVAVIFFDTHMIGMYILNPFEPTKSSISLDQITRTIEINLLEMMDESDIPEPVKPIDEKYVM